jgi:hypothetical protein
MLVGDPNEMVEGNRAIPVHFTGTESSPESTMPPQQLEIVSFVAYAGGNTPIALRLEYNDEIGGVYQPQGRNLLVKFNGDSCYINTAKTLCLYWDYPHRIRQGSLDDIIKSHLGLHTTSTSECGDFFTGLMRRDHYNQLVWTREPTFTWRDLYTTLTFIESQASLAGKTIFFPE